jgi:hypothetical protein
MLSEFVVGMLFKFLHHVLGIIRLVDLNQSCSIPNLVSVRKISWSSLLEILSCTRFRETSLAVFKDQNLEPCIVDLVPK